MRLLAHTIAKLRRGYPLASFSLKALYLLEHDAIHHQMDQELATQVKAEILKRLGHGTQRPTP